MRDTSIEKVLNREWGTNKHKSLNVALYFFPNVNFLVGTRCVLASLAQKERYSKSQERERQKATRILRLVVSKLQV